MYWDCSCLGHIALRSGGAVQALCMNALLLILYPEDRGICSSKILVHIWLHILKTVTVIFVTVRDSEVIGIKWDA